MNRLVALSFLLGAIPAARAAVILVEAGQAIQAALNQAVTGDIIQVAPGTYTGNLNFGGKAVTLRSTAGAGLTTIAGINNGTTVQIGGAAEISGFTITGGNASFGAGMAVSGTGTRILNNVFQGNIQGAGGYGAAIGGNGASPLISGNIFTGNSSDSQFLSGAVSFINSSSPIIQNNLFYNNPGRGLNITGAAAIVTNNTFSGNTSGIRIHGGNTSLFQNNILGNNGIGFEVDFLSGTLSAGWNHNLMYNNVANYDGLSSLTGVNGNLEGNPFFLNAAAGNFRLGAGSAAIDTGTSASAPLFDFAGNLRPLDGNGDGIALTDIGAYEYIPEPHSGLLVILVCGLGMVSRRARHPGR